MHERFRSIFLMFLAVAGVSLALSGPALAQVGRVSGEVKDEAGKPVKGASVTAENPNAVPSKFTATTDDRGRFAMAGLKNGRWIVTIMAPGYVPTQTSSQLDSLGRNPPLAVKLVRGAGGGGGGMAGLNSEELQKELAVADDLFNKKQYDEAMAGYKAILGKVPQLSVLNLQIAAVHRAKKEWDLAIAAYNEVLKGDANNERAKVGIGLTQLEKGDLAAAETTLTEAAAIPGATREVFYNLGEVKFAKNEPDEAAKWYQRAAEADPAWGKPLFKLGLVALNKGDKTGAATWLEKVMAADPNSPEAAQAKAVIAQLK
jgi:tetratricopeptide (TPR) repeat protein